MWTLYWTDRSELNKIRLSRIISLWIGIESGNLHQQVALPNIYHCTSGAQHVTFTTEKQRSIYDIRYTLKWCCNGNNLNNVTYFYGEIFFSQSHPSFHRGKSFCAVLMKLHCGSHRVLQVREVFNELSLVPMINTEWYQTM